MMDALSGGRRREALGDGSGSGFVQVGRSLSALLHETEADKEVWTTPPMAITAHCRAWEADSIQFQASLRP